MPQSVKVDYSSINLMKLQEVTPDKSWEKVREISLGTLNNKEVKLYIYKDGTYGEINGSLFPKGIIMYDKKTYQASYPIGEVGNFLLISQAEETEPGASLYRYNKQFSFQERKLTLVGAYDSSQNGPGVYSYLLYDNASREWFTFDEWGTPYFVDLDKDGNEEFLLQFEGVHNNLPDVFLLTWKNGKFEKSNGFKSLVHRDEQNDVVEFKPDLKLFEVRNVAEVDKPNPVYYKYEKDQLIQVKP